MQTRLIHGVDPAPDDGEVLAQIRLAAAASISDGRDQRLGIENSGGVVYREVTADGFEQASNIASNLEELGFEPDFEKGEPLGYDFVLIRHG